MTWLLAAAGVLLVAASLFDALWTTLWLEGHSGPIVGRLTLWLHRLFLRMSGVPRGSGRPGRHRLLSVQGPAALMVSVLTWLVLSWGGWVLLFSSRPGLVVNSETQAPATLAERVYFIGYTMFTMGNGDFIPVGGGWQVLTAIASLTGFGLLTLTITYLLSVLEAVVRKRALASQVFALGRSPEDWVINAWDGRGFRGLELQLMSIAEGLSQVTEQHRTYPMLHYYHSESERHASPAAVVLFAEALTLLRHGVAPECRPAPAMLCTADSTIDDYVGTLTTTYLSRDDEPPDPPRLSPLRDAGIPVVDEDAFAAVVRGDERRHLLKGLLDTDGRGWPPSVT